MSAAEQAYVFAWMTACGAALGAAYDALGAARRVLRAGGVMTGLLDVLYGLGCGAGVIGLALYLRVEAYRLYVLLGVGAGMGLYAGLIGMPVRVLASRIRKSVKKSRMMEEKCQNDAGECKDPANI